MQLLSSGYSPNVLVAQALIRANSRVSIAGGNISRDSSPFPAVNQQQKRRLEQCNTLETKEIEAIQAGGGARRGGGEEEQMSASKPVRFKKTYQVLYSFRIGLQAFLNEYSSTGGISGRHYIGAGDVAGSVWSKSYLYLGGQFNNKGGAFGSGGILNVDFAAVIIFDDAFRERKPQAPAAFFGGVARQKDLPAGLGGHTLAVIADCYDDFTVYCRCFDGNFSVGEFDCLDAVFEEIFDDPFKEFFIDCSFDGKVELAFDGNFFAEVRHALLEIEANIFDDVADVFGVHFRLGADFGEPCGDDIQPRNIMFHFADGFLDIVGIIRIEP